MGPVLLLLLLAAENSAAAPENSTGLKFLVAFPENIASYHPVPARHRVRLTALYDDTLVTLTSYSNGMEIPTEIIMSQGESKMHELQGTTGRHQTYDTFGLSKEVLQITSSKSITVHAINWKHNSVQTALVLPTDKLAKTYLIPPVPEIKGTTFPSDTVTPLVTERGPFRLVIINGENVQNSVTVKGKEEEQYSLSSNQMLRVWLKDAGEIWSVEATGNVAVLFGHPCALRTNCTCGQLFAALPPTTEQQLKFYIPAALANGTGAFVLLSDGHHTRKEVFNPDSLMVDSGGSAILYRPGLLLPLIPESDFAACYVVHSISDTQNYVHIVVHKVETGGVHVEHLPLVSQWEDLEGTDYVSTTVALALGRSVIWHASSTMAVYFMGRYGSSWFGNPAAIISTSPDFRGCVLSPEVVTIGEDAVGWRESVKHCCDQKMELISFPDARHQTQVNRKLLRAGSDGLQVWIGMRRSSQSGQWYWLNRDPVSDTDWEEGEPGTVHDGQCAAMRLDKEVLGWSDKDCCEAAHPVCYSGPIILDLDAAAAAGVSTAAPWL